MMTVIRMDIRDLSTIDLFRPPRLFHPADGFPEEGFPGSMNLLQAFGKKVTKNFIELTKEQTINYANGSDIIVEQNQLANASDGYILLRYQYAPLGCGLLKGKSIKKYASQSQKTRN
jgi:NOL1/NOP2/fmu family ribosome biogenesis protein